MKLSRIYGGLSLVGLLCIVAACGGGGGGPSASKAGAVTYVVSSCHEAQGIATLQQELRIYHRTGETVVAMSVGPLGPFASYGWCGLAGRNRGTIGPGLGAFQRVGMTPDGSGAVLELNDAFAPVGAGLLPLDQRGIYYVRADGTGLRRLSPEGGVPAAAIPWFDPYMSFDLDGRQFTYTGLGPDEAGDDAPQVLVQQIVTGEPRQLTELPRIAQAGDPPDIIGPSFIDAHTILFTRFSASPGGYSFFTVDTVTNQVSEVPTVAADGGTVIPVFHIIGGQWRAINATVSGEPVNGAPGSSAREVFVIDGENVLQVTDFHRVETSNFPAFFSPSDGRVYFTASADPLDTNPSHDCQIFSIDPLTRGLRQVTFFHEGGDHEAACWGGSVAVGCRNDFAWPRSQDPITGAIYFRSTCDPLGLNPDGSQLFAIQPDGTGLRQLTSARGYVRHADGTTDVELVDFLWVSATER